MNNTTTNNNKLDELKNHPIYKKAIDPEYELGHNYAAWLCCIEGEAELLCFILDELDRIYPVWWFGTMSSGNGFLGIDYIEEAVKHGHLDIIKILISVCPTERYEGELRAILEQAKDFGFSEIAKYLEEVISKIVHYD